MQSLALPRRSRLRRDDVASASRRCSMPEQGFFADDLMSSSSLFDAAGVLNRNDSRKALDSIRPPPCPLPLSNTAGQLAPVAFITIPGTTFVQDTNGMENIMTNGSMETSVC